MPRSAARVGKFAIQLADQIYDRLTQRLRAVAPTVVRQSPPVLDRIGVDTSSPQTTRAGDRCKEVRAKASLYSHRRPPKRKCNVVAALFVAGVLAFGSRGSSFGRDCSLAIVVGLRSVWPISASNVGIPSCTKFRFNQIEKLGARSPRVGTA